MNAKRNRNPFAGVIRAAMNKPVAIVLPDTAEGREQAKRELKARHGDRLLAVYKRGGFKGSRAHLACYYPRLKRR